MDNKIELLTAEQARQLTRKHASQEEISRINSAIKSACEEGKEYTYIEGSISMFAKKDLEQNGFKVEYGSQYNEAYSIIKWEKD